MRKLLGILSVLLFTFSLAQSDNTDITITQGLAGEDEYSTLVSLLVASGLDAELDGGDFTVFAPRNGAFEKLSEEALAQLNADPELLRQVLLGHVVQGVYGVNDLQDAPEGSIMSLQGEALEFNNSLGGFQVNGANFNSTDVEVSYANGVVHGLGDVVIPMSMKASFDDTGMFSDMAMAGDMSTEADMTEAMSEDNLATVLTNDGRFSTLLTAVEAAGLTDAFTGEQQLTVFAPTDEAFAALPEGELDALLADREALARVLSYHVVDGRILSSDLSNMMAPSLAGDELDINVDNGVLVNGATVTEADIAASNGVIHVIDTVLIPAN